MRRGAEAGSGGIEEAAAGSTRPRGTATAGTMGRGVSTGRRRRSAQHGHDAVDERQRLRVRQERIGIAARRGRARLPLDRVDQRRRAGDKHRVLRPERGQVVRRPPAHHRIGRAGLGGCDDLAHAVVRSANRASGACRALRRRGCPRSRSARGGAARAAPRPRPTRSAPSRCRRRSGRSAHRLRAEMRRRTARGLARGGPA